MDKKFLEEFLETYAKGPDPPPITLEELIKEIDEVRGEFEETKLDIVIWQTRVKGYRNAADWSLRILDQAEASGDEKAMQRQADIVAANLQKVQDAKSRLNPLIEKKAELETLLGYLTNDLINSMSK